MTTQEFKTKTGAKRFRPTMTMREYEQASGEGNRGFCLGCGAEADGCEPDARQYECEICGLNLVYGPEELVLMGLLTLTPSPADKEKE